MYSRFDTESRIAVTQAADIARELGHREVGPGHLLAGLLANPRGTAYAALRDHGLDLDTTRDLVATHHVEPEPETDPKGDQEADQEADPTSNADGGGGTRSERSRDYDDDRRALEAIGIDLDRVREAVRANLGDDLAERWGDRPRRERGRGRRGRSGHHHRGHGHGEGRSEGRGGGRGRRGPRSRRGGDRGDLRFSRELRALLHDVRRSVLRDQLDAVDAAGGDRAAARRVPGLTGARMVVALTRSDDPAVRAVLATATDADGLAAQARAEVEAATKPTPTTT